MECKKLKGLQGTNTLAYFASAANDKEEKYITVVPSVLNSAFLYESKLAWSCDKQVCSRMAPRHSA
jgi:hypothetical protein